MRSYNGRVSFKIPRRMSSATELPCNVQYGEHHSDHYSALPGAAASGYNSSDVNLQRFAKEFGFQRGPWKPNRPEGVCCCPAHEGHMCTTLAAALPGLLGGAGGPGGITMKPYPQFAVNSDGAALPAAIPAAPVYPHFSTMDPVHKAVIKHAFGVRRGAAKARRKRPVDCGVCRLTFNSDVSEALPPLPPLPPLPLTTVCAVAGRGALPGRPPRQEAEDAALHRGCQRRQLLRHRARPLHGSRQQRSFELALPLCPSVAGEAERPEKRLYCLLCKVAVNSLTQLEAHNLGAKHKSALDARGAAHTSVPAAPPANETFRCQTCDIHANSETQFKQHVSSRRHKDRLAGKPSKPRFNKSQRAEVTTTSDWSSPLQSSSDANLTPPLAHPAPGPIRANQSSALFSPY
ncbi:zinc finger protein 385D-like isoform X1 [Syngnathus acus]|uniref:zinc finger protein 385D-like isoform X1 n=1 Tax=Syngnathus acus TaxID=161584 RepID=UPI001886487C|nr:zinc finger protein 385D-like isoform X1 [Syngnathus acus]